MVPNFSTDHQSPGNLVLQDCHPRNAAETKRMRERDRYNSISPDQMDSLLKKTWIQCEEEKHWTIKLYCWDVSRYIACIISALYKYNYSSPFLIISLFYIEEDDQPDDSYGIFEPVDHPPQFEGIEIDIYFFYIDNFIQ
jgi:hypothetical protein